LRAIVTDEQDTRLPIDARASVIVLAAQLRGVGECHLAVAFRRSSGATLGDSRRQGANVEFSLAA